MMENFPGYEPEKQELEHGTEHSKPEQPGSPPPPAPNWSAANPGIPPPPPPYTPQSNRSFLVNMLRGLGIALLGCVAVIAGLFGACFMVLGGMTTTEGMPYIIGSGVVFAAALLALIALLRPRKVQ
jgi:hypothetical protein